MVGVDIAVDFMDMDGARRLWARRDDVRAGVAVSIGRHVVVGDEDAEPRVARIESIDAEGNIELVVLAGSVEAHRDLLTTA